MTWINQLMAIEMKKVNDDDEDNDDDMPDELEYAGVSVFVSQFNRYLDRYLDYMIRADSADRNPLSSQKRW